MPNVIKFPNGMGELPATAEEARKQLTETRTSYANEVTEEVIRRLFMDLEAFGFKVRDEPSFQKDMFFLSEAVQAHIFRHSGLKHNMQILIDKTISFDDAGTKEPAKTGKKRKYKSKKKDPAE